MVISSHFDTVCAVTCVQTVYNLDLSQKVWLSKHMAGTKSTQVMMSQRAYLSIVIALQLGISWRHIDDLYKHRISHQYAELVCPCKVKDTFIRQLYAVGLACLFAIGGHELEVPPTFEESIETVLAMTAPQPSWKAFFMTA